MMMDLYKKYYDKIDCYVNALVFCCKSSKNINQQEIKYLIFQLEEAKINCKNNKYFNVNDGVLSHYDDYKEIDYECFLILDEIDNFLDDVHDDFMSKVSRYASKETDMPSWEIESFISQMFIYYNDFYEELVNILINGIALNDDYIKVGPLSIAKMYFEYNLNFIDGYKMLMSELNREVVSDSSV